MSKNQANNTRSPVVVIKGKVFWCQLLGEPRDGYNGPTDKEWTVDITLDQENRDKLVGLGMHERYISNDDDKGGERGDYITFRRKEKRTDGLPGKKVAVFDKNKDQWDPSVLIGNGSEAYVRVALNTVRQGFPDERLKPNIVEMMVTNHVKYEPEGGSGISEDFPTFDETNGDELPF